MRENVNRGWGTHMLGNTKMGQLLAALTNKERWFSQQEFLSADATRPPASQNTTSPLELDNRSENLKVHARGCKLRLRTKLLSVGDCQQFKGSRRCWKDKFDEFYQGS